MEEHDSLEQTMGQRASWRQTSLLLIGASLFFAAWSFSLMRMFCSPCDSGDSTQERLVSPGLQSASSDVQKPRQPSRLVPASPQSDIRRAKPYKQDTRYLFVQQYLDHLGYASDNLKSLLALGKALNRTVVAPVVQNARLNGYPTTDSHRPLDYYFDDGHLNRTLDQAGISRLASIHQLRHACAQGWDVVVHFHTVSTDTDGFGLSQADSLRSLDMATEQRLVRAGRSAFVDCPHLAEYVQNVPDRFTGFRRPPVINASKCVEGGRLSAVEALEHDIFQQRPCVNILFWASKERTGLPLNSHLRLSPFQLFSMRHSLELSRQTNSLKRHFLGMSYIGIHISVLSLLQRYAGDYSVRLDQTASQLQAMVKKLQPYLNGEGHTYLVSDIDDVSLLEENSTALTNISDLLDGAQKKLSSLRRSIFLTSVEFPQSFSDQSSKMLINADILSSADYLLTVGNDSYQSWVVRMHERKHYFPIHDQHIWRFLEKV